MKKHQILKELEPFVDNTDIAVFDKTTNELTRLKTLQPNQDGVHKNFNIIAEADTNHQLTDSFAPPMVLLEIETSPLPKYRPMSEHPDNDAVCLIKITIGDNVAFHISKFIPQLCEFESPYGFFNLKQEAMYICVNKAKMPEHLAIEVAKTATAEWIEIDKSGFLI